MQRVERARSEAALSTKNRLIDVSLKLFVEHGVDGTAIPLIAERAGIATGTVYRHFESKNELVNTVYRQAMQRMKEAVVREGDEHLPMPELFAAFWQRLTTFVREQPLMFDFLHLQNHTRHLDARSRALEMSMLTPLFLGCARGQREGVLRKDVDVDVMMAAISGVYIGLIRAARIGLMPLDDAKLTAGRDACWRAFATNPEKGL